MADASGVKGFDAWPPNFTCGYLVSAHPAFQLLSEVTSPGAASDPQK